MKKNLSLKQNNVTFSKNNLIFKIVDKDLFFRLKNLKNILKVKSILHHKKALISGDKYILIYSKENDDYTKKEYFKKNILDFVDFIFPVIKELNSYNLNDNGIGFIHDDPQVDNYVIIGNIPILIDLEAIKYGEIVFQPLYLFTKCLFDIDNSDIELKKECFKKIFTKFLLDDFFLKQFNKYSFDDIIKKYLILLKKYDFNEYYSSKNFIENNLDFIKDLFKKYLTK